MLTRRQWAASAARLAFGGAALSTAARRGFAQTPADASTGADWPLFRGNPSMTGVANARLAPSPKLAWTHEAGEAPASPVISGGRAFVADSTGKVAALDLTSGTAVWTVTIAAGFEGAPSVAHGRLLLGDLEGVVHALDPATGKTLWSQKAKDAPEIKASVVAAGGEDGVAVVGSYDGTLHAFDLKSGARKWTHETDAQLHATCAVAGPLVFAAGCDGRFRGLDATSGGLKVDVRFGGYTAATPAIVRLGDADFAVFGTFSDDVVGIDLKARAVAWRYTPKKTFPFFSSAAVTQAFAFVGSRDKSLHVLKVRTGELAFDIPTSAKVDSSPLVDGGRVFFGSHDGRIRGVDIATRETVFSYDAGVPIGTAPAAASGRLLCAVEDGRILCFK